MIWSNRNVVDYQCHSDRDVGAGNGVLLHDGWIHTHPPCYRNRDGVAPVDQRPSLSLNSH